MTVIVKYIFKIKFNKKILQNIINLKFYKTF